MAKKAIFKMAAAAILNFINFNFWSRDCHRVQYLLQCTKFYQNRTIFHPDMAIYDGGRLPSWILKICSFCLVAFVGMLPHTEFR